MFDHVYYDLHAQLRHRELIQEANMERLANLVRKPRPRIRVRLASWLYAIADRVDGQPSRGALQAQV
jgi:hypothetical protein